MSTELLGAEVAVPGEVSVSLKGRMLQVSGPLGRTFQSFRSIPVDIELEEGRVRLRARGPRKRDHAILNAARSLVRNLVEGVVSGYTVRMKVVFAHFPITIKVDGDRVVIENFQGERSARTARIVGGTKVEPSGDDVVVSGHVKTHVTQTAANIELGTRVKGKDHRVFLDGVYAYEKRAGLP